MAIERSASIIGLPGAGKSTFIGALAYVLLNASQPSLLKLSKFQGKLDRINFLKNAWLEMRDPGRTLPHDERRIELLLDAAGCDDTIKLIFPDLSGESIRQQWEHRICEKNLAKELLNACGILFFIHADKFSQPMPLIEVNRELNIESSGGASADSIESWTPKASPTQVKVVDLIQLLCRPPLSNREKRRIAIILSAWDLVEDTISPSSYLAKRMPLLNQFLKNGIDQFEYSVFGVSAQGGTYESEARKTEMARLRNPSDRIIVVESDQSSHHDLTVPIAWTIGLRA